VHGVRLAHLTRRFFGSLWPLGPDAATEGWAEGLLSPAEHRLWRLMTNADRRHAAAVGRRTEALLGEAATRPVLAAALLHDIGKTSARLGTYGRVIATVAGAATRHRYVDLWIAGQGMTRRVGLYLRHADLGAEMLALAGSDPLTIAWTAQHHLPPDDWSIPVQVGTALKAADDD
jgi:hypothetical protein